MKFKKLILSWLLHHANRYYKSEHFYKIKARVLSKYGIFIGNDFQYFEGKKCWACDGTGIYKGYNYQGSFKDICFRCNMGWYIRPHWNVLEKISFGKYTFHKPFARIYEKPKVGSTIIEGYISHDKTYWSHFARIVIFLLYDFNGYGKNWRLGIGGGWYMKPKTFKQYINNFIYVLKYKTGAFRYLKAYYWADRFRKPVVFDDDDLPF